MKPISLAALALSLLASNSVAQKRALTQDDYDSWRSLSQTEVSHDGKLVAYVTRPAAKGDSELVLQRSSGEILFRHERATSPKISKDGKFLVFRIGAGWKEARDARRRRGSSRTRGASQRPTAMPPGLTRQQMIAFMRRQRGGGDDPSLQSQLAILEIARARQGKKALRVVPRVRSFSISDKAPGVVVFLQSKKPEKRAGGAARGGASRGAQQGRRRRGGNAGEGGERRRRGASRRGDESTRRGDETAQGRRGQGRRGQGRRGQGRRAAGSPARGAPQASSSRSRAGTLVFHELASGEEDRISPVLSHGLVPKQPLCWYSTETKDKNGASAIWARRVGIGARPTKLASGPADFRGVTHDRDGTRFAFFRTERAPKPVKKPAASKKVGASKEAGEGKKAEASEKAAKTQHENAEGHAAKAEGEKTPQGKASAQEVAAKPAGSTEAKEAARGSDAKKAEKKPAELWIGSWKTLECAPHIGEKTAGFPAGRELSTSGISFSRDGSTLMFRAKKKADKTQKAPKIPSDEKVTVDIWHWKDPLLQPMQAKQVGRMRNRSASCAYDIDGMRITMLSDESDESLRFVSRDGSYALAQTSQPYAQLVSWDGRYSDYELVRTSDGRRDRLLRMQRASIQTSPSGRWAVYFRERQWHSIDLQTLEHHKLTTSKLGVDFDREDWDTPQPKRAYGIAAWTDGDERVLIYDRYDIWSIAADGSSAVCMTDGAGRASKTTMRLVRLDRERETIDPKSPQLLSATNTETYATGYYRDRVEGVSKPQKIVMLDKAFGRSLQKAKGAERYYFTLSTFRDFGDLWTAGKDLADMRKLSDVNPQQKQFRWGDAELVRWVSNDGVPLKGILIKPEGFDPNKKYPMLVYIYEKLSQNLHRWRAPSPGTSASPSYYASNGYLFFMPDIVYKTGYPGQSCFNCVMPGVQSLIRKGFVKRDGIGIAGHSWGGYQVAYLATRTTLFKAIESGAPVSNMTSAYGGIRWSSGMSRMFQYERTQSRIGGTLWEHPMRYLENSPVFTAYKIETPMLILHNDEDGAVPWYQGIELFVALRRLGKEAYMFNYNGAGHGLRRRPNTMDWTRRMWGFFEHHLNGKPMPEWMAKGVPYSEREKEKWKYFKPEPETKAKPKAEPKVEISTTEASTQVGGTPPKVNGGNGGGR